MEAVPVVVHNRKEADDPALAAQIEGAGLVYLSGGNPPYCASALRGTKVWAAVEAAWRDGAALAGCSAGAMSLTSWVPDLRHPLRDADPGLGVVPHLRVIPHFDRFVGWMPDLVGRYLARAPEGVAGRRHRRGHRAGLGRRGLDGARPAGRMAAPRRRPDGVRRRRAGPAPTPS